jgi:predicted RNA-binding Zn-ribbon protein involved in translation (DUF1610 family)
MTREGGVVVTALLAVAAGFLLHAKVKPKRVCTVCDGVGELGKGRTKADCPRCGGAKRTRRWLNRVPVPVVLTVTAATVLAVLVLRATAGA